MICSVCKINQAKYTCPICKAKYCCLNCAKIHKSICSGPNSEIDSQNILQKSEEVTEEISISPFEIFKSFPEIMNKLSDPRLQDIIIRIDQADDREKELVDELARNKEFEIFVHQLLDVAPKSIEP